MPRRTPRQARRRPEDGRPLALTDDIEKKILDLIRAGVPLAHAAAAAGIARSTYHLYMQRGEDAAARAADGEELTEDERRLMDFSDRASRARAESVSTLTLHVAKAAQGGYVLKETTRRYRGPDGQMVTEHEKAYAPVDWRAAYALLRARAPEDFGQQPAGRGGEPDGTDPGSGDVTSAEVRDVAARIAANISRVSSTRTDRPELGAGGPVIPGEVVRD